LKKIRERTRGKVVHVTKTKDWSMGSEKRGKYGIQECNDIVAKETVARGGEKSKHKNARKTKI